jgi:hypothetical protein
MPGDLHRHVSSGLQPAQSGAVTGFSPGTGQPLSKTVQWLFDTGSDVCVVPEAFANQFALRAAGVGTTAQGIGGGLRLLPRKGLTVEFAVEDATGTAQTISQPAVVFIGGQVKIIGMKELTTGEVTLTWNPKQGTGKLTIP